MITAGLLWVALGLVAAFFLGAVIHIADARRPRPESPELREAA